MIALVLGVFGALIGGPVTVLSTHFVYGRAGCRGTRHTLLTDHLPNDTEAYSNIARTGNCLATLRAGFEALEGALSTLSEKEQRLGLGYVEPRSFAVFDHRFVAEYDPTPQVSADNMGKIASFPSMTQKAVGRHRRVRPGPSWPDPSCAQLLGRVENRSDA